MRKRIPVILVALAALAPAVRAAAQAPAQTPAMESLTFDQAVERAIERNPSAAMAAAQILRAEGMLAQARSAAGVAINGTVNSTTLNTGVSFDGNTVVPRSQLTATVDITMPLYAPASWARRTQAMDQRAIATLGATETRRQVALAAADLYLSVIASHRVVEANERAQKTAGAHYDYAHTQLEAGTGSLLNELRAQQELSSDAVLVESSRTALYRAQEALGVLLVSDGPVDASGEPAFDVPPPGAQPPVLSDIRPDLRLYFAQQRAAERVVNDSRKDWWPSLQGIFQPSITYPAQFFSPQKSWRAILQLSVPIFDQGQRAGQEKARQASLDEAKATTAGAVTQAQSEVRVAREAIASAERALTDARAAADQAQRVVQIVDVSFKAGASTNLEVIDAERAARDADTAVAVVEDTLRRAKLNLLAALGRFPG